MSYFILLKIGTEGLGNIWATDTNMELNKRAGRLPLNIHLLFKCLLNIHYVPGTSLDTGIWLGWGGAGGIVNRTEKK